MCTTEVLEVSLLLFLRHLQFYFEGNQRATAQSKASIQQSFSTVAARLQEVELVCRTPPLDSGLTPCPGRTGCQGTRAPPQAGGALLWRGAEELVRGCRELAWSGCIEYDFAPSHGTF
jgi:hypothetical protein